MYQQYEEDVEFDMEEDEPESIISSIEADSSTSANDAEQTSLWKLNPSDVLRDENNGTEEEYIRITQQENIIESNMADMPIFSFKRPSRKEYETDTGTNVTYAVETDNNIVKYEWTDASKVTRGFEVVGSTRHGIPVFSDLEVLMAITKASMRYNNRFQVKGEEYEMPNKLYFTKNDVARILGYNTLSGMVNERIETSIHRMMETTLYNYSSGGLWNAGNKTHERDTNHGYHIIESYFSQNYRKLEQGDKRKNYKELKNHIVLNQFFYESMCRKYFKIIDYDLFLGYRHSLSKRIYLILHKWRGGKHVMNIRYETLYARIPLTDDIQPKRKKHLLKQAMEELYESGYIKEIEYKPTYMTLYMSNTYKLLEKKTKTFEELKIRLLDDYELTEIDMIDLFGNIELREGENLRYLQALITYCDYQVQRGYVTNRRNYIRRGFVERYDIPKSFYPVL